MLATQLIIAAFSSLAVVSSAPIPAIGRFVGENGLMSASSFQEHQVQGNAKWGWQGDETKQPFEGPQTHLNQFARVVDWPTNEVTSCGHRLDQFANDEPWVAVPPSYGHATCGQRVTLRSDRGVAVGRIVGVVQEAPDRVDVTKALFTQLGYGYDEVPETPVNLIIG